jgi:pimeloyl-ACP methyl ester carboxylesterase
MTEFLDIEGGRIAYDVTGEGPLIVLAHGIGDRRQVFRFLAPQLVQAGFRVAVPDMRGHGESSMGWESISRTDVAGDLIALIRHLGGGPAVIVGHSLAGGSATIAAATAPDLVIMGDEDPDWADPRAEAEGIVAAMPAGAGTIAMIKNGGHYIHAQRPDEAAGLITGFIRDRLPA